MNNKLLSAFVAKTIENKRITFGDVKRLQRTVLPDGITTREEAEVLVALDQAVAKKDTSWTGYLVAAVVEFAVWGSRPTGYVDEETARWLVSWLSSEKPTKAMVRIARELVSEAEAVDQALLAFVTDAPASTAESRAAGQKAVERHAA